MGGDGVVGEKREARRDTVDTLISQLCRTILSDRVQPGTIRGHGDNMFRGLVNRCRVERVFRQWGGGRRACAV